MKRLELESQERIRLKELEVRLAQENGTMDRQTNNGQGDNRPDHRGTIRDMQIPVYEKNSHDLNSYLNRFERICTALRRSVGIGTGKVPKESCVRSL